MNFEIGDDELDRVLGVVGEIVPSSGFVSSVMEAVHHEATVPRAIPFPWKWALPGFVASVGLVVFFLVRFAHAGVHAGSSIVAKLPSGDIRSILPQSLAGGAIRLSVEWSVVALLISFVAVWLSMRIARE